MHRHFRMASFGSRAFSMIPLRFALHAKGRHGRGPGGLFAGGRYGDGADGEGLTRGRKFSSDDLQLMLLALLEEKASHGYELIKAIEAHSNGFYTPSPGMIYPALTYLEELGYVTASAEGNKKCYALANEGREHLSANRERLVSMQRKLEHIARKMDRVRRALSGEAVAEDEAGAWLPELIEARHALKHALFERLDAPLDEQRRIAAVLVRATAEITGEVARKRTAKGE